MRYYPVNLDIQNRRCLVVGGGSVGTRKVMTLLECEAVVTVVSLVLSDKLSELADNDTIEWKQRCYRTSDIDGMFLVIGATDDEELNQQIHSDAEHLNKLCNIADRPESCNFILPSIIHRGDLMIAISTSGKSPAFAKHLRKTLEKEFGTEYDDFLKLMGAIRKRLLAEAHAPEAHKPIFEQLIKSKMLEMIKKQDITGINKLFSDILGKEYTFESLMV